MSRYQARPRPNGQEIDAKAPDGFLLGGWRRVCRAGYIRFHGARWRHPDLQKHAGEYVWVHVDCPWATEASWTADRMQKWRAPAGEASEGRVPLECIELTEDAERERCAACNCYTHPDEAACIYCGVTKERYQPTADAAK